MIVNMRQHQPSRTPRAPRKCANAIARSADRGAAQYHHPLPVRGRVGSVTLENLKSVDQLDKPSHPQASAGGQPSQHLALLLIAARPDLFSHQGCVAASWRKRGAQTFGPYYRLVHRVEGRQQSLYLGRAGALVDQVRRALTAAHRPLNKYRLFERLRRQIRASLRIHKISVRALLRPFGLRLKGYEVRGCRISPLRNLLPRCRRLMRRLPARAPSARRAKESPAERFRRYLAG
jgi:hypothetical protein